jgi:hypothetical protein
MFDVAVKYHAHAAVWLDSYGGTAGIPSFERSSFAPEVGAATGKRTGFVQQHIHRKC